MARTRTTKKLAQRIDLNYFKRPTALKRAKLWLSVGAPALAVAWIVWQGWARDSRVYSSGTLSQAHAVLEQECSACHVKTTGTFPAKASDAACLSCHDGPMHHVTIMAKYTVTSAPRCADCHAEHRGRINLRATSDESCARCHGDLKRVEPATSFVSRIKSFEDGHPEFEALRENARDPGTIRVNHALHMKPIRSGPNGPNVQLECGDCHRTKAAATDVSSWKYADAKYVGAAVSYSPDDELRKTPQRTLASYRPATGREQMAPVRFAAACAGCHSLAFDKRFSEGVPHDKPEAVHTFLVKRFTDYIAAHPGELREMRDPGRDLTGTPVQPEVRIYRTPKEWILAKVADAEQLLWRKTCKQCHNLGFEDNTRIRQSLLDATSISANNLPTVAPAITTLIWMPHANFDHDAHRGFSCVSCHEKAMTSTEASDVLLPGIASCRACHAPGPEHAESRCFECHTYHDWAKRKEVKPTFTLPALRTGVQ